MVFKARLAWNPSPSVQDDTPPNSPPGCTVGLHAHEEGALGLVNKSVPASPVHASFQICPLPVGPHRPGRAQHATPTGLALGLDPRPPGI